MTSNGTARNRAHECCRSQRYPRTRALPRRLPSRQELGSRTFTAFGTRTVLLSLSWRTICRLAVRVSRPMIWQRRVSTKRCVLVGSTCGWQSSGSVPGMQRRGGGKVGGGKAGDRFREWKGGGVGTARNRAPRCATDDGSHGVRHIRRGSRVWAPLLPARSVFLLDYGCRQVNRYPEWAPVARNDQHPIITSAPSNQWAPVARNDRSSSACTGSVRAPQTCHAGRPSSSACTPVRVRGSHRRKAGFGSRSGEFEFRAAPDDEAAGAAGADEASLGRHHRGVVVDVAKTVGLAAGKCLVLDGGSPAFERFLGDRNVEVGHEAFGVLPVVGVEKLVDTVSAQRAVHRQRR